MEEGRLHLPDPLEERRYPLLEFGPEPLSLGVAPVPLQEVHLLLQLLGVVCRPVVPPFVALHELPAEGGDGEAEPGGNCIKIGLPGKLILRDYFKRIGLPKYLLLLRISFPGRPIYIQLPPGWSGRTTTAAAAAATGCPGTRPSKVS